MLQTIMIAVYSLIVSTALCIYLIRMLLNHEQPPLEIFVGNILICIILILICGLFLIGLNSVLSLLL